ncbi:YcgN family cysteine cluster protein [Glaciecola sp. 1036]|uniref:YcgN family cysteine cluster protein n=1 Tax=Alteromonadaceae TaxID=72275 RepID=UPI003D02E802
MAQKSPHTAQLIKSEFWKHKTLSQMSKQEWEAICDGCGRCCLHKFIEDTESSEDQDPKSALHYTNIACFLLNDKSCACMAYEKRTQRVPDCATLTAQNLEQMYFMPPSCSYRRFHEGKGLSDWHPLLNKGKKTKMHELGISVRNKTVSEEDVNLDDFEDYIVTWPLDEI